MNRSYVIISPVRNEAHLLPRTIEPVATQTVLPATWIIVDDGSTDETADVVREAAAMHDWIRLVQRPDRGDRKVGGGVIEAFYDGLDTVNLGDYSYVCKLDGDLVLPKRYFERVMEHFEKEPALGTMSGKTYIDSGDGTLVSERVGDDMSLGAMKFYRVACFQDIGGFQRIPSWDGIDCRMPRCGNSPRTGPFHSTPSGPSTTPQWCRSSGMRAWTSTCPCRLIRSCVPTF